MSLDQFLDRWKAIPIRARGIGLLILLTVFLVGMAAHEHMRRMTGREIILTAHPVDPRDVLRGAYVALEYNIEEINTGNLAAPPHFSQALMGQTVDVWLVLNNSPTGWEVSRVLEQRPATIGKDEILMRAKWKYARDLQTTTPQGAAEPIRDLFTVDIGADRYFAEEARAKALEKAIRDKQFQVVLSVGGDGRPVIKGLVLDGVRSDETFF